MHHLAREGGIVVDEGDELVLVGFLKRAHQLDAERARAIDDDALPLIEAHGLVLGRGPEQHIARPLPAQPDETRGDQAIDHDHRAGMSADAGHEHDQRPDKGGDDHRDVNTGGALRSDEARDELVQPAQIESDYADERRRRHQQPHAGRIWQVELAQAQRIGSPQREAQHHEVVDDEQRSLEPARTLDEPNGKTHEGQPRTGRFGPYPEKIFLRMGA